MRTGRGTLRRPFDHADVVAERAKLGVGATVLVQAADNAAARLLDGWQRAGEPVVGVRHLVHREADPDWLLRPRSRTASPCWPSRASP